MARLATERPFQSPSFRGGSTPFLLHLLAGFLVRVSIPFVSGRGDFGQNPDLLRVRPTGVQAPSFRGGSTPDPGVVKCEFGACNVSIPFVSGREHSYFCNAWGN